MSDMRGKKGKEPPERTKKVVLKPRSKRQVKRFLKGRLAATSAVVYFTGRDHRPFLLGPDGGGVSAGGEFRLTGKWKLTKESLRRIFIIAAEEDVPEDWEAAGEEGVE